MGKSLLLTLLMLFFVVGANAQSTRTQKTEVEIGANHAFGSGKRAADRVKYKPGGYFELRFNLKQLPLDLGFRINQSSYEKKYRRYEDDNFYPLSLLVVANYSFLRGRRVNPYVGLGIGFYVKTSFIGCDDCSTIGNDNIDNVPFAFTPNSRS